MVCKEDVLLWFKDLESYKRIDIMYELLNMCIPFEVRFLGSCIEEMGKHTFHELRGPSINANDVERLSKDPSLQLGLLDEKTRHRAVIYMSVLSARNCSCANWFYRTLFRTETVENFVNGYTKDDSTLSEFLLLFTLGIYHPAFTFEQKSYFGKLLDKLITPSEGNKYNNGAQNVVNASVNTPRTLSGHQNTMPVKTSPSMVASGDTSTLHPPPGLPPPSHQHPIEFLQNSIITGRADIRPAFQPTVVGAPDMHPFPPQPVSPLMNQSGSPPLSRATSPPRNFNMRPLPTNPLHISNAIVAPIPPEDMSTTQFEVPLPQTPTCMPYNSEPEIVSIKSNDDDSNHISEEKLREHQWLNSQMYDPIKQLNGVRPSFAFITDQIQVLKLDSENSLHCSNSTSSNNSNNQSPTETPSITPSVTPHGPGRGGTDSKTRMNGIPHQFIFDSAQMPFSTVPYTMPHVPPNRYYAHYRPHFPYPYHQNDVYTALPPYSVIYSSNPPQPSRNPNCFNCGGMGHSGNDCNGHTVEDITQKPYILDYGTIQDTDK